MPSECSELGVSPETLELLGGALSRVPIDELRQFVALMEAVESAPCPPASVKTASPRRALATRQRPRRHECQPRKLLRRFG